MSAHRLQSHVSNLSDIMPYGIISDFMPIQFYAAFFGPTLGDIK